MSWIANADTDERAQLGARIDRAGNQEYLSTADGDREYAMFLAAADVICLAGQGVSIFDLDDWTWRDAHDDGTEPREAVSMALKWCNE